MGLKSLFAEHMKLRIFPKIFDGHFCRTCCHRRTHICSYSMETASNYDENQNTVIICFIIKNKAVQSLYMLKTAPYYAMFHMWKMGQEAVER